jgi:cytochrome c
MMKPLMAALVLIAGSTPLAARADGNAGDAMRGQQIYESRCVACHSPDANRVGPMHRGVFGRKAGSVVNYNYSKAVLGSDVVWNDQTLDQWLTNPQVLIPGQKMNFKVANPQDRADVIAYLKTLMQ